jgi:hypothetical protein
VEKAIFVHSDTSWDGKEKGNHVRSIIKEFPDPKHKIVHLECGLTGIKGQERQHEILADYLAKNKIDFDYLMYIDTDEVWDEKNWKNILPVLEKNLSREKPAEGITTRLHIYIKSPFFRVDPQPVQRPISFIRASSVTIDRMFCRGGGIPLCDRINEDSVTFHHFCSVRKNLDEVWAKHQTSTHMENVGLFKRDDWVYTVWNKLPYALNICPMPEFRGIWKSIKICLLEELPEAVRDTELVRAWLRYPPKRYGSRREYSREEKLSLARVGLPADFNESHPDWNMPSKRNKYERYLMGLRSRQEGRA